MNSLTSSFTRAQQPILLGIGFAILLVIGAMSIYLVQQSGEQTDNIAHTLEVQNTLTTVLLNLRRAESSQRGYLLSEQPQYLETYRATKALVGPAFDQLRKDTADNPLQQKQLQDAEPLIQAKFSEMDKTIAFITSGQKDLAYALVSGGSGREIMETLREQFEKMISAEGRLLVDRTAASARTTTLLQTSTLFGIGLIVLVGALAIMLMRRSIRDRQRALMTVEATNANLETIVSYRTADLTEANEEIQRFAYIVSHDLRSPLVNIMGFTSELEALRKDIFDEIGSLRGKLAALEPTANGDAPETDRLDKDFDEALGFIKSSITKMDRLINAVLKLSREGRREFKPERIDMTAMLRAIESSVAHQAKEAGASLVVNDVPEITSDRLALEQVFSNLMDNAVKYLKANEPGRIEVTGQAKGRDIIYQVRDNGRGIDPADHQRIFELFRRAGPQDRPGEGIGLAHVRALVRRLGGNMSVESEFGKGSVFSVTLPRRWSAEDQRSAA